MDIANVGQPLRNSALASTMPLLPLRESVLLVGVAARQRPGKPPVDI